MVGGAVGGGHDVAPMLPVILVIPSLSRNLEGRAITRKQVRPRSRHHVREGDGTIVAPSPSRSLDKLGMTGQVGVSLVLHHPSLSRGLKTSSSEREIITSESCRREMATIGERMYQRLSLKKIAPRV